MKRSRVVALLMGENGVVSTNKEPAKRARENQAPVVLYTLASVRSVVELVDTSSEIFSHLSLVSLLACAITCKAWNKMLYGRIVDLPYAHLAGGHVLRSGECSVATLCANKLPFMMPNLRRFVMGEYAVGVFAMAFYKMWKETQIPLALQYSGCAQLELGSAGPERLAYDALGTLLLTCAATLREVHVPLSRHDPSWNSGVMEVLTPLKSLTALTLAPCGVSMNVASEVSALPDLGKLPSSLTSICLSRMLVSRTVENMIDLPLPYNWADISPREIYLRPLDGLEKLTTLELDRAPQCHWDTSLIQVDGLGSWNARHPRFFHSDSLALGLPTLHRLVTLILRDSVFDLSGLLTGLLRNGASCLEALTVENTVRLLANGNRFVMSNAPDPNSPNEDLLGILGKRRAMFDSVRDNTGALPRLSRLVLSLVFGASGFVLVRDFLSILPALDSLVIRAHDTIMHQGNLHISAMPFSFEPSWINKHVVPREGTPICHTLRHLELSVLALVRDEVSGFDAIHVLSRFKYLETARLFVNASFRSDETVLGSTVVADASGTTRSLLLSDLSELQHSKAGACRLKHVTLAMYAAVRKNYVSLVSALGDAFYVKMHGLVKDDLYASLCAYALSKRRLQMNLAAVDIIAHVHHVADLRHGPKIERDAAVINLPPSSAHLIHFSTRTLEGTA